MALWPRSLRYRGWHITAHPHPVRFGHWQMDAERDDGGVILTSSSGYLYVLGCMMENIREREAREANARGEPVAPVYWAPADIVMTLLGLA